MAGVERVTITLPDDLLRDIDRLEKNRSKFVGDAVRRELERRRRMALHRSLDNSRSETPLIEEEGLEEWARGLPEEDTEALVDSAAGKTVRWAAGEGWLIKPKCVLKSEDALSSEEARIVRRGEAQLKRGESKPWRVVKDALQR